jgi:hypothetical protein
MGEIGNNVSHSLDLVARLRSPPVARDRPVGGYAVARSLSDWAEFITYLCVRLCDGGWL